MDATHFSDVEPVFHDDAQNATGELGHETHLNTDEGFTGANSVSNTDERYSEINLENNTDRKSSEDNPENNNDPVTVEESRAKSVITKTESPTARGQVITSVEEPGIASRYAESTKKILTEGSTLVLTEIDKVEKSVNKTQEKTIASVEVAKRLVEDVTNTAKTSFSSLSEASLPILAQTTVLSRAASSLKEASSSFGTENHAKAVNAFGVMRPVCSIPGQTGRDAFQVRTAQPSSETQTDGRITPTPRLSPESSIYKIDKDTCPKSPKSPSSAHDNQSMVVCVHEADVVMKTHASASSNAPWHLESPKLSSDDFGSTSSMVLAASTSAAGACDDGGITFGGVVLSGTAGDHAKPLLHSCGSANNANSRSAHDFSVERGTHEKTYLEVTKAKEDCPFCKPSASRKSDAAGKGSKIPEDDCTCVLL